MSLNGEFLKEQEEKAKRKAEEEAAKPPKVKRKRRKININARTAGTGIVYQLFCAHTHAHSLFVSWLGSLVGTLRIVLYIITLKETQVKISLKAFFCG